MWDMIARARHEDMLREAERMRQVRRAAGRRRPTVAAGLVRRAVGFVRRVTAVPGGSVAAGASSDNGGTPTYGVAAQAKQPCGGQP